MKLQTVEPKAGVDFHIHTSASDGTDSPREVVDIAAGLGIAVIAITDHDTLDGLDAAQKQGEIAGVRVIRGIELSAEFMDQSAHILGLGIGEPDREFREILGTIIDGRENRNPRMVQQLNLLGMELTMDDVRVFAEGQVIGRVHIARAMIHRGYVADMDEAFRKYIARGKPAYIDRYRLSVEDAVAMIHRIGGIAVVAHPGLLRSGENIDEFQSQLIQLKAMGIDGVETHYPTHCEAFFQNASRIALDMKLLESGGSDYHGSFKFNRIGYGAQNRPILAEYLSPLPNRLGFPVAPNPALWEECDAGSDC